MHLADLDVGVLWGAIESAAEQAGIVVYVARVDSVPPRMLYVSPRAAEITGRSIQELTRMLPWQVLREEDQPRVRELIGRPAGAPPMSMSVLVQRPDGTQVPIDVAATRIHTPTAELTFGYFRDTSTERAALSALRQSEARFRFLVTAAPDGVVILKRGVIVFINPRAVHLLGLERPEEAVGQPISAFLPPADAAATAERIATMFRTGQEMPPSEYGVQRVPDRIVEIKSIACEWEDGPAVLAFARDVTERAALQRRLVEADRLAALGTLAAGVAHEINNPMTYASLAVQRIERALDSIEMPPEKLAGIRELLNDIDHGIGRVSSITRSLRAFARPDDSAPGPVDLAAVVGRALKMVDNELRHRATLELRLPAVPFVTGNSSRLEQVVVNILLNAIQALPEGPANRITVSVDHTSERVVLAIRDTGHGIPAAVRHRLFEPFFTTRAVGAGMGLGLSVSKTIIDGIGGEISVESKEGAGTTVTIALRPHPALGSAVTPLAEPRASQRLRILLIDDEPLLRTMIVQLLDQHHDLVTLPSGSEALRLLGTATFDLIICDVMMPAMNGMELYRRIAADHPGVERRVVFITGGTFTADVDDFLASIPNRVLHKPFKLETLLATIVDATKLLG